MSAAPDIHAAAECLNCGAHRAETNTDCPRCGYVGWAFSTDLDEQARRSLRDVRVEDRRGAVRFLTVIQGGV